MHRQRWEKHWQWKSIAKLSTHIVWKSVSDALLFDDRIYPRVDKYSIIRCRLCRHRISTCPCKYQSAYLEVVHNHLRLPSLSQPQSTRYCIVVGDWNETVFDCCKLRIYSHTNLHQQHAAACQTLIISHATQCSWYLIKLRNWFTKTFKYLWCAMRLFAYSSFVLIVCCAGLLANIPHLVANGKQRLENIRSLVCDRRCVEFTLQNMRTFRILKWA